ncbi:MAG: alpha-isopropylmalate synthase regulatory domain-containing protein [Candidatus Pacebacteria bacterium]|nr:alpha-isopropylmalate synthase regulatory domain-containing protein [Candidatus Paceibacterota bacterium]
MSRAAAKKTTADQPVVPERIKLVSYRIISGTKIENNVSGVLHIGPERTVFEESGTDTMDALCKALQILAPGFKVMEYDLRAANLPSASEATANVVLASNGRTYGGVGRDGNMDVAMAKAVVGALNQLRTGEFRIANGID